MFVPKAPQLVIGRAYFCCGYYLRDVPVPEIETWIYIGQNIFDEDQNIDQIFHYFEHPTEYFRAKMVLEYAQYDSSEENQVDENRPVPKLRVSERDLEGLVYDYGDLLAWVDQLKEEPNADQTF